MTTTLLILIHDKTDKKTHFFEVPIFLKKVLLLSISRNYMLTLFLDDTLFENFSSSNSIILVGDQIRWKRGFEIFLINNHTDDIGNKNIAGKYWKILVLVSPTLYLAGQFTQGDISIIPWFI